MFQDMVANKRHLLADSFYIGTDATHDLYARKVALSSSLNSPTDAASQRPCCSVGLRPPT